MKISIFLLAFISSGALAFTIMNSASEHHFVSPVDVPNATPTETPTGNPHQNGKCLDCHSKPFTVKFQSGETTVVAFDPSQAVHNNFDCGVCHDGERTYPHVNSVTTTCSLCHWQITGLSEPVVKIFASTYQDQRAMVLGLNEGCKKCHGDQLPALADSAHAKIMADGNRYAPVCVDCHGAHDIAKMNGSRTLIPQICSKCHEAEYSSYRSSVHGSALEQDSNPDVPTCGDCHGIHKVTGPSDVSFRPDSIDVCGKCHADKNMMGKYKISTDVFQTYLNDFHGRTVDFFRTAGETQVPTATCYDCHGIHNIRKPDDPLSNVYPTNLQKTCSKCHTDANINFPQAWLSHYSPTWQKTPALFVVNQAYAIFIPSIIGGFIVYIAVDVRRRLADWSKKRRSK